jgi:hypothetical protein
MPCNLARSGGSLVDANLDRDHVALRKGRFIDQVPERLGLDSQHVQGRHVVHISLHSEFGDT